MTNKARQNAPAFLEDPNGRQQYGIMGVTIPMCPVLVLMTLLMAGYSVFSPASEQRDMNNLIADIEKIRRDRNIPAVGLVLVNKDGPVAHEVFGLADKSSRKPARKDTIFRIGSITKSFTSLAVLLLLEDGILSLDDRLTDIAPEFEIKNRWRDDHPIRIAHLLEHTAGLPGLTRKEFDFNEPLSLEEALAFRERPRRAEWPPGMHHSYTNAGAGYVAYVIEKKTGLKYEEFVEDRIFKPLGMKSAGFFPDERTRAGLATGYDSDGNTVIPYWHMLFRAFGAINMQIGDVAPFLRMLLNHGEYNQQQLIGADLVKRMETPETTLAARDGLTYGYGLGNYTWLRRGHLFHGHGGDGDGYLARYGYNREADMAYFVVINVFRNHDLAVLRHRIEDFIIRPFEPVNAPSSTRLSREQIRRFSGVYRRVTHRFRSTSSDDDAERIRIVHDAGMLYQENSDGNRHEILPVTRNHFRFSDETVATMAFVEDPGGNLFLQGDDGNFKKIANGE